jgi:hypothetical protein
MDEPPMECLPGRKGLRPHMTTNLPKLTRAKPSYDSGLAKSRAEYFSRMIESDCMERGVRKPLSRRFRSGALAAGLSSLLRSSHGRRENCPPSESGFGRSFPAKLGGLVIGLLMSLVGGPGSNAHDLPYGQVERAIQVTAYPDHVEVQYQFGMHERMIWEQLHGVEGGEERSSDEVELLDSHELARLETEFLAQVASQLASWINLEVAGERWECSNLTTELIYQHHLQFECRLRFDCPENVSFSDPSDFSDHSDLSKLSERTSLRFTDGGFSNYPGHYRVAVRGRGGVQATSDTAALLLVRAPRLPILAESRGRLVVPPIRATLGQGPSRPSSSEPLAVATSPERAEITSPPIKSDAKGVASRSTRNVSRGGTRGLPGWIVTGIIALAALSCLPLLLLSPRRRESGSR